MIREALDSFQLSTNLTENIMREIARIKPLPSSGSKPWVPWAIAASTTVLVVMMLGIGNQYLARFQQPYNFDATSEMTVDIIEAPIVLVLASKPDVRTQLGRVTAPGKNDGSGQRPDAVLFAAVQAEGEDSSVAKQQWIQVEPLRGSLMQSIFATHEGELYVIDSGGSLYKLSIDGKAWRHILNIVSLNTAWGGHSPIAKWDNTLYLVPSHELFVSTDGGETWHLRYSWPREAYGYPIEFMLMAQAFYLAFDNGIFRSEDTGKTWEAINDGLTAEIRSLVKIQKTLFAGTDTGLYRLSADSWERLKFPVPSIGRVRSVAVTKDRLYVVAELAEEIQDPRQVSQGQLRTWWMFRSTDLGESWKDITPTNAWPIKGFAPHVKLVAAGETLLAMERGMVRSTDGGDTWLPPQSPGSSPLMYDRSSAVVVNAKTIYAGGGNGLYRSTDGGESWEMVNIRRESRVDSLIVFKEIGEGRDTPADLYARVGEKIIKTTDSGRSWKGVQVEVPMRVPHRDEPPRIFKIVASGGVLYAKGTASDEAARLYRVSAAGRTLVPIQGMPIFHSGALRNQLFQRRRLSLDLQDTSFVEQLQAGSVGATQFFKQLAQPNARNTRELIRGGLRGTFAVSDDTFYMEYNFKLFRWKPGEAEWFDTGLQETAKLSGYTVMEGFKLAVSRDTVYVGKRDGTLAYVAVCVERLLSATTRSTWNTTLNSSDGNRVRRNGLTPDFKKPLNFPDIQSWRDSNLPFHATPSTSENGMAPSPTPLMEEIIGTMSLRTCRFLLKLSKR